MPLSAKKDQLLAFLTEQVNALDKFIKVEKDPDVKTIYSWLRLKLDNTQKMILYHPYGYEDQELNGFAEESQYSIEIMLSKAAIYKFINQHIKSLEMKMKKEKLKVNQDFHANTLKKLNDLVIDITLIRNESTIHHDPNARIELLQLKEISEQAHVILSHHESLAQYLTFTKAVQKILDKLAGPQNETKSEIESALNHSIQRVAELQVSQDIHENLPAEIISLYQSIKAVSKTQISEDAPKTKPLSTSSARLHKPAKPLQVFSAFLNDPIVIQTYQAAVKHVKLAYHEKEEAKGEQKENDSPRGPHKNL